MLRFKGIVHLRMGLCFIMGGDMCFQKGGRGSSRWKTGRSRWSRSREPGLGGRDERENPAFGSLRTIPKQNKSSREEVASCR
jgi:hypothetical protein